MAADGFPNGSFTCADRKYEDEHNTNKVRQTLKREQTQTAFSERKRETHLRSKLWCEKILSFIVKYVLRVSQRLLPARAH